MFGPQGPSSYVQVRNKYRGGRNCDLVEMALLLASTQTVLKNKFRFVFYVTVYSYTKDTELGSKKASPCEVSGYHVLR